MFAVKDIMGEQRQQELRELAEQLQSTADPQMHDLAEGTLELLTYVNELMSALQMTTETCCEAMCAAYDNIS